MVKLTPSLFWS